MKIINRPSGPIMTNTYLVYDEGTKKGFIVDPGGFDTNLTGLINDENIDIEYIMLTHGHGDHIGGVEAYKKLFPQAKLLCSEKEKDFLANGAVNLTADLFGRPFGLQADVTVNEGDRIKVGNMEFRFTMTPGHTEGGMCIIGEGVVFSGDTLFCMSIGRTDFPGGSFQKLKDSIHNKLFTLPDETRVFPGHEAPTTIGFEKMNNPFV